jgi:stage III sporulation protein AH
MLLVRKKHILAGVLGVALVTAGIINYGNQPGIEVSGDIVPNTGEASSVSEVVGNLEVTSPSNIGDAYFVSAKLERDRTYGEQIEIQENILYNEKSDDNMKKIAQEQINHISNNLNKEMSIETLLKAKGFDDTVAIINDDSVNVVVKSMEELGIAEVAQIQNIVMRESGASAENIHIVTKN